jgi:hypothetical protein
MASGWKGHKIKYFADYVGAKLRPTDLAALEALAEREQCSLSEMIRRSIAREHARQLIGERAGDDE